MSVKNTDENLYEYEKELNDSSSILMLVDSSTTIAEIKKIPQQEKIKEIISFDYESHKLLKWENIPHVISDDFSSRNDLIDMQNNCYEYVKWFEDDTIK